MKVCRVLIASVSSAFLVASAAASGSAYASAPGSTLALTEQAYKALAAGQPEAAIVSYSTAIESRELAPESLANALLNRALAQQQLGKHDLAIDDYTAALRLDAMSGDLRATALYNRGLSHQKSDNMARAVEDFTSALFLNPKFAHAYYNRGNALRESGQLLFALSDYERAARYQYPNMARVRYSEGLTFAALRRPADARNSLQLALDLNPGMAEAKKALAKLGDAKVADNAGQADPVLTNSIAALGGGLVVRKPKLPKAIEPPDALVAGNAGAEEMVVAEANTAVKSGRPKKKFTDRVPTAEQQVAALEVKDDEVERVIAIEAVPEIPAAETTTSAKEETASAEPGIEPANIEPANAEPVDDTETASIDKSEQPVASGWTVQIASANSENAAWSTWKKMQKRHSALAQQKPVLMRADLGSKGIFYRLRLAGYDDQKGAVSACSKLKSKGVSCFVSKASS